MFRFCRLFLLPVVLLWLPLAAKAQSRTDCNVINSRILKQSIHYCVQLPPDYDTNDAKQRLYPVLYFLHGLGQNEQMLFSTGGWSLIEDLRRQHKISDFLIVAPEGGRSFYINSADNSLRYGDFFLQEFIPHIESRYRVRPGRQGRAITGVSMGGYGALRFAFAQPINLPHWNQNSVFVLAKKNESGLHRLAIYFNCGQRDDFGFEDGAAALHQQLQAEGVRHEYRSYPGDHSLTYFLSHMGEVMEFHSGVFAEQK